MKSSLRHVSLIKQAVASSSKRGVNLPALSASSTTINRSTQNQFNYQSRFTHPNINSYTSTIYTQYPQNISETNIVEFGILANATTHNDTASSQSQSSSST